jgi:hypothetical protein
MTNFTVKNAGRYHHTQVINTTIMILETLWLMEESDIMVYRIWCKEKNTPAIFFSKLNNSNWIIKQDQINPNWETTFSVSDIRQKLMNGSKLKEIFKKYQLNTKILLTIVFIWQKGYY